MNIQRAPRTWKVCMCGHALESHEDGEGRCLVACSCDAFEFLEELGE